MKLSTCLALIGLVLGWAAGCQSQGPASPHASTATLVPVLPGPTNTMAADTPTPLAAIASTATPTRDMTLVFQVSTQDARQTIEHVGSGAFVHKFGGVLSATDPVSELNLSTLQPRFVRVAMDLANWEPENDNEDPASFNNQAFQDGGYNHATFEFMKLMQARGAEITASIWDVPNWMVSNPKDSSSRLIPHSLYPEAIESIVAWLVRARDQYGLEVAYISFNEANLGVNVLLSPADVIKMVRQSGPRFAELGLKTRWLLGDCSSMNGCLDYLKPVWAEKDLRPYLGPLAFHSWDAESFSDAGIAAIGDFARQEGLEVRATETGWDAQLWQRPDEFPTWQNARRLAAVYNRILKSSGVSAIYYWQMMGHDYNLNSGSEPYLVLQVIQQMNELFPPGSQILGTSPNTSTVAVVAARTPKGVVLHFVNQALKETVRITGLPDGSYDLLLTDGKGTGQLIQTLAVTGGTASFALAGFSIQVLEPHTAP